MIWLHAAISLACLYLGRYLGHCAERYRWRLLAEIHRAGPTTGIPLRKAVGGSVGTLYVTLEGLEHEGLVGSKVAPGGPERGFAWKRVVWITDKGRAVLGEGASDEHTP